MVKGHRIKRKVELNNFSNMMENYSKKNIICTDHTFFRLSEKQRKVFKCEKIREYLFHEIPHFVGIQHNECYAVIYKYEKKKFIRIMLDIIPDKINVVTFYVIDDYQLPKIK